MRITLLIASFFVFAFAWAQHSSVNGQVLDSSFAYSNQYSFVISGHFYGDGFNKTHYPANTVLGNIELFNSVDFTVCLGDLYKDVKNDHAFYQKHFYSQLQKPLFNAVGNHDVSGSFYEDNIAQRFYRFSTNGIQHIVLDGEENDSKIEGAQLDSLKQWISEFNKGNASYLMLYAHRPIWAEEDSLLSQVFIDNTKSDFGTNFIEDVLPLLQTIPDSKRVFWFGGSMGAQPYSFFYHNKGNVTYAITAVRGAEKDAVLMANYSNGKLSFQTHSLTGQELMAFEEYTIDNFLTYTEPVRFNYRLIPLWIKNTLFHRYFWYGVISCLVVFGLGIVLKNKWF